MERTKRDLTFLCILGAIVIILGSAIYIMPQKSFSQKENRSLSQLPKISASALINGEYFKALGDFYSDQFPLRNSFTAARAIMELSLGKGEANRVIIANNGALVTRPNIEIGKNVEKNIEFLSSLENTVIYIPPSSAEVFESALPYAYASNISTAEGFADSSRYLYYNTDHHWTTEGAYVAYRQICEELGITPYAESFFTKEIVSEDFRGTSYARSCLPSWAVTPDIITLYRYEGDEKFTVLNHENRESFKGFYREEHLTTADKYRVFLGGNYSHLSISGESPRKKLLLIKDSFANSLLPFLALHYDVEMIDPRYCTRSFLNEQLSRTDISKTLVVLSVATLEGIK